jgi:predicted transcriptional regulator
MLSVDLKLLQQNRGTVDKRETKFGLTAKGEKFLEELKHAHR